MTISPGLAITNTRRMRLTPYTAFH
jgi:hypothetical protein